MAAKHFAKLDANNIVIDVQVVDDSNAATEAKGQNFLRKIYQDPTAVWKLTGENPPYTKGNAGKGAIWDPVKKMFHSVQPFPSWTLNEDKGDWDPPIPIPIREDDGRAQRWNEDTKNWDVQITPGSSTYGPEA